MQNKHFDEHSFEVIDEKLLFYQKFVFKKPSLQFDPVCL